jgi:hypothetical protein
VNFNCRLLESLMWKKKLLARCALAGTAILLLAAVGCDESPTAPTGERVLEIFTTQGEYAPGDLVEVHVSNVGSSPVAVWLCPQLQRRALGSWLTVPNAGGLPCLSVLTALPPGDTRQLGYELPNSLSAGTYRFRLPESFDESPKLAIDSRISNPFEVHSLQ